MAALGYTALKFDLDLPGTVFDSPTGYTLSTADIDWMVRLTERIREAVGGAVDLAMDAHWRYRPNDILQVAKALESCRLMWLEDPVPPDDRSALRYLRQHTIPRLCVMPLILHILKRFTLRSPAGFFAFSHGARYSVPHVENLHPAQGVATQLRLGRQIDRWSAFT